MKPNYKHKNYEILNLLGYGLAKFDIKFIEQFGFKTKISFFKYFVDIGLVNTTSVVKNRMDLFDPFFDNYRKGWWQKGNAYIHRKNLIDNLFGKEDVYEYSNVVKLILRDEFNVKEIFAEVKPIVESRFKKLQETGLEAEIYFLNNYEEINFFEGGSIQDARLYGDGYDFQVNVNNKIYLAEIKGIRTNKGSFRLTENEYYKALKYKNDYIVSIVKNLDQIPYLLTIPDPLKSLDFKEKIIKTKEKKEYQLISII